MIITFAAPRPIGLASQNARRSRYTSRGVSLRNPWRSIRATREPTPYWRGPTLTPILSPATASHQLLDEPRILEDPVAVGLAPEASEQAILDATDEHRAPLATLFRSLFAFRNRFAEDRLADAVARGVHQYVIVGAGLDTFPWRQPPFAKALRIFYVDHPATLAWTTARFHERGLPRPPNLAFVAADLEEQNLADRL